MKMLRSIPALPVRNIEESLEFYRDKLGFMIAHHEDGFAILKSYEVRIHLWEASDESWQTRDHSSPVSSGAESFIAGTASCRIEVEGINELYERLKPLGILHPNAPLRNQQWGERDFSIIDSDNNLISFYEQI